MEHLKPKLKLRKPRANAKQPHLGPKCPQIPLALDSGAHSMYNAYFSPKTSSGKVVTGLQNIEKADFSYYKSPAFRKYLEDYIEYLHKHKHLFTFSVTLDIIFNPEASWEIYKEMTNAGLKVLPVYHFGEDVKWLKKYMDETDYIGVGGIGQQTTKQVYLPFGERTWKTICDSKGRPRVKVHGFAMSSFDFLSRWPWYSVDSTTAFTFARMGAVIMPRRNPPKAKEKFDFLVTPTIVPVTKRRSTHYRHIAHHDQKGVINQTVIDYLELFDLDLDAVMSDYMPRDVANLYFFHRCMTELSKWHSERLGTKIECHYYASGNPSANMDAFLATLEWLGERNLLGNLGYLGTFFKGNQYASTYLLKHWYGENIV